MNVSHRMMRAVSCAVRNKAKSVAALLMTFGLVAASVTGASAEGFAISTLSARGGAFGGGFAGGMVGRADDASAVFYNPAGITQIPGTTAMAGLAAVALNLDLDTDAGWTTNSHQVWPIPHAYLTHQLNDDFWFGIGMFTRWGLGHSYPDNWAAPAVGKLPSIAHPKLGKVQAISALKSITLLSSTINPTIAYKLNDTWSVAAGVSYTWGYLSLNNQLDTTITNLQGVMSDSADIRIHSENGRSFGYNFGLHARFNDQWSAGLTYRSHERMKFNGSARVRGGKIATGIAEAKGIGNSRGKATLVLPDVITLGVAYKPTDRLSFEADVAYTVWSRWRSLNVDLYSYPDGGIHQQKNWRDTWALSFSTEYWLYDWLALRAGILYETSPLNGEAYHDYFIPTNGRMQYTAGFGLRYEDWTLDFAYVYMQEREVHLSYAASNGETLNGKFGNGYDHTFALTLGYRF